jgi:hypothetical protein
MIHAFPKGSITPDSKPRYATGRLSHHPSLLEKVVQLGLGGVDVIHLVGAILKSKTSTVIGSLPIGYVLGNVLPTLIVTAFIPVLAILANMHVLRAVGAYIRTLHLDTVKI